MDISLHRQDNLMFSRRSVAQNTHKLIFKAKTTPPSQMVRFIVKKVSFAERTALSTNDKPCKSEPKNGLENCVRLFYHREMQCLLPWDTTNASSRQRLRFCDTRDDFLLFTNLTLTLAQKNQKDLFSFLDCDVPCQTMNYIVEDFLDDLIPCRFGICHPDEMMLTFSVVDDNVYVEKETWLYDRINFVADVGGYLGLLLGVSAVSCFECFKMAFKRLKKKLRAHRANGKNRAQLDNI